MFPLNYALAIALLASPETAEVSATEGLATVRPTLQALAISWEFLDPRECRYVLTRAEELGTDLKMLRRRFQELADAPPLHDCMRFPDRALINDLLAFNRAYRQHLDSRQSVEVVHWWELREKYQGVKAPIARADTDFDPGAKYHVPANVAYMRYFLAAVLQFQFHRALCKIAGHTGPLHECSIYQNKAAGDAYAKMLSLGASKPWQEALYALTGQREMDASAILEYFAPLQKWLEEQNKGQQCGW